MWRAGGSPPCSEAGSKGVLDAPGEASRCEAQAGVHTASNIKMLGKSKVLSLAWLEQAPELKHVKLTLRQSKLVFEASLKQESHLLSTLSAPQPFF